MANLTPDQTSDAKLASPIPTNWADPLKANPVATQYAKIPDSEIMPVPLGARVLILVDEPMHQQGKIIIAERSAVPPLTGLVVRVGTGVRNPMTGTVSEMEVEEGDIVYFEPFAGTDLRIGGLNFKSMHHDDCSNRMPRQGEQGYEQMLAERQKREQINQEAKEHSRMPTGGVTGKSLEQLGLKPGSN